ncbi:MAG: tRNA 2-thiouridine(34) synthase MnmA [Oscillospiraceae bacterium]|nr:tRNA 2-thiouridine(34) synthase MnmA [Oscillospiraceae bacterium]
MNKKVLVGMSGGVDSSVCAYLLKASGYEPTGINCRFFDNDDAFITDKTCCSLEDANDARNVAYKLGIPFYVFNFTEDFRKCVIENFVETYMNAATPNPCIECNRRLKFDKLLKRATELDHDYVATGHYAKIETDPVSGRKLLKKGIDPKKDQSYVLYMLNQFQLAHTLFPLGGYTKTQIREIAEEQGFLNSKKHESQDICFIPDGDYAAFIEKHTGKTFPSGEFVTEDGKVLGTHKGIIRYTVGQRRGLGLALPAPLYVKRKDLINNRVVLSPEKDLYSSDLDAENINIIVSDKLDVPLKVKARIRYNQPEQPATVTQTDENRFHVHFDVPQRAIAKGQAVVLYDGDIVVGGGTII